MPVSTAIDSSAVARVVGIQTNYQDFSAGGITQLPQRIMLAAQGSTASAYSADKRQITSAVEAGQVYGFGSPIHLAALQLLPVNGDGVGGVPVTVYPLEDDGSGVAAVGDITPVVAQTEAAQYVVRINGIDSAAFVIAVGAAVADVTAAITQAINATVDLPVTAVDSTTKVDFTVKWAGVSSNDVFVEVIGSATAGTTFAVTQAAGGLVNPDIQTVLDKVGDVWETALLNAVGGYTDSATLDKIAAFGEGRWGALTKKPMFAITGTNESDYATLTAVTDLRGTDRVNVVMPAPDSVELPFVIAARALARIASRANNNPSRDYGSMKADGLVPGADDQQWDYLVRDTAVKAGLSTTEVKDSTVSLSDTVTCYHPEGDPLPAYRYVVDIVKLQNIIFNLNLIFETEAWDGAPLIPDGQATTNPDAKSPKMAKAAVASMVDSLGLNAIISDPETAKKNIVAQINEQNPKRLDIVLAVQLSGNANIISIDLNFGFWFGSAQTIA